MTKSRIGILGGGQLARMMALSAYPLGFEVSIFATHASDPAAQVCGNTHLGSLQDQKDLSKFLSGVDAVTFESEFVDTEILSRSLPSSVKVFPSLAAIECIQDRLTQKQLLDRFKIPTSPWREVSSSKDLDLAAQDFPEGFVLKQRRFGYDGYGTTIVRNPKKELPQETLKNSKFGFIAENLIQFKRELAVVFVRSSSGDFLALPLVESVQQDSRCFSVVGPVQHKGIAKIAKLFKSLMKELDYQGVLAVELFETSKGLIVNELAPRVHNSAHYTQDALNCDQFEFHLRAGLGLDLPPVELLKPGFAMVNLLGGGRKQIQLARTPVGVGKLHWYGKSENRAGRKLGHINVLAKTSSAALKAALKWRKGFQL